MALDGGEAGYLGWKGGLTAEWEPDKGLYALKTTKELLCIVSASLAVLPRADGRRSWSGNTCSKWRRECRMRKRRGRPASCRLASACCMGLGLVGWHEEFVQALCSLCKRGRNIERYGIEYLPCDAPCEVESAKELDRNRTIGKQELRHCSGQLYLTIVQPPRTMHRDYRYVAELVVCGASSVSFNTEW